MSERINGIKINTEKMTDQEVLNALDYAIERAYRAEQDVDRLLDIARERGLVSEEKYTQDQLPFDQ